MSQEVITRRQLPHWYVPGAMHFVTYRLAGTIPTQVLHDLRCARDVKLRQPSGDPLPQHVRYRAHKQFFAEYDRYLDTVRTVDWLADPRIAALIRGNLYHHNGSKHHLLAFCVMPNHVHVLLQPVDPRPDATTPAPPAEQVSDEQADSASPLAGVMHSLKSYTANQANQILSRTGRFWQHESYDHWVRDEDELERIVDYIAWNPVKAGLVREPHEWFFSSAHDRFVQEGIRCGFLEGRPATVFG